MGAELAESKQLFEDFINRLRASQHPDSEAPKFKLPEDEEKATEIIAGVLHEISQFVYSQSQRTGDRKSKEGSNYYSDFHKFWEENHEQVLGIKIDEERCKLVAEKMESYCRPYEFKEFVETHGLSNEMKANVRLFVTLQDFGVGFKADYYELGKDVPYLFRAQAIQDNPQYVDELARELGVSDYQVDKRREWGLRLADLLVDEYEGEAFNIGPKHDYDAVDVHRMLTKARIGISSKKADMFLRDMNELDVWDLKNYDKVNVASDMNTMRLALRTGIVRTRIPLLTSFLDVFCYQYGAMAEYTKNAWRKVWEIWNSLPENHCVPSPADIDFAIYRLGQRCCRANKRLCDKNRDMDVPLTDSDSYPINRLLQGKKIEFCVFTGLCDDDNTNPNRKKLNPPKSISIYGRTGWTNAKSNEGGGLGLRA